MYQQNEFRNPILAYIGQQVFVQIDRPLGSIHPQHGFRYPVNYGFVPGVPAADGEEQDAYILEVCVPLDEFEGECIAVIHRKDDREDKLVVVPSGVKLNNYQIWSAVYFQEQFFHGEILRG